MSVQTGLREAIIKESANLFIKQGYAVTSIKQIAKAAGCTTAALYYYFEGGKRAILREVLQMHGPDLSGLFDECEGATSLEEVFRCYMTNLCERGGEFLRRVRWIVVEYPNMAQSERDVFHQHVLAVHQDLSDLIAPFVDSRQAAEVLAWVQVSAMMGYYLVFSMVDMASATDAMPEERFIDATALLLAHSYQNSRS